MKIFSTLFLAWIFLTGPAFAADQTVLLAVPGMNCAVCPITVKKALQGERRQNRAGGFRQPQSYGQFR